jgi:tRNA A-37 threonylcarbamoyl transferase component Bud32
MCYTIASLRPSARATYPQEADDLLSIPIADAEGQHAAQISSSPKYHLRAQMVALTVAAIGIGISSWQIMPMYTSFGVLCSTGVALLFGLLTVAVSNGYVTATILRRVWAAIGIFGAFGSMLNAPFMDEADLVEYIRLEPERREAMHLGMLAVGSAHALFSFSLRMEVGITMWVIGCSILQNACFYFRTGDPSVPIRECLGATIPFSIGLAITELILRSSRRSRATPDKEPDFTPESACSEIQGITTSIAATPASNVGYARECDVSPGVEVEEFSEATEADSTRSSSPRHTVGVLCDLTLELLSVDLQINWSVLLGKGGASDVHLGEWLGTAVAVKVVRDKGLQLLRTEAKLLAQLRHPCICSVFGTMELGDGHRAIVLEYMSGGTAFELLHKKVADAPLPTEIACRIARETASGLAYLHTNSYMHRDVKSSNVLLDKNLHAKVADFGIAKHSALASGAISLDANPANPANPVEIGWNSAFSGSTHTFLMGTPRYMAPVRS